MAKPHLISEHPISMAELKLELENVKKRDTELNFRANKTEEYISQVLEFDYTKAEEIKKKISKLEVPRLKEEHICKILDLNPKTAEELKVILQGYTLGVTKENLKKIVDVLAEYSTAK